MKLILLTGNDFASIEMLAASATQALQERGEKVYTLSTLYWDDWPGQNARQDQLDVFLLQLKKWSDPSAENTAIIVLGGEVRLWGADLPQDALDHFTYDMILDIEDDQSPIRRKVLAKYPHIHYLAPHHLDDGLHLILEMFEQEPVTHERKWHIDQVDWPTLRAQSLVAIELEQYYLTLRDGLERRIRKRWAPGETAAYYLTEKEPAPGVSRVEKERRISAKMWEHLLGERDMDRKMIRKTRYCFTLDGHHAELDLFASPRNLMVLEVELPGHDVHVDLPQMLQGYEVTGKREYLNSEIAYDLNRGPKTGQTVWVSVQDIKTGPRGMQAVVKTSEGEMVTVSAQGQDIIFQDAEAVIDGSIWRLHL